VIGVLAAVIAGIVLLTTDAGQNTSGGELIKDTVNDQVQALEDFIGSHTE
jgi:hypothetical protein